MSQQNPTFDFITVIGKAYQTAWAERGYFLKLALIPFLVKLGGLTLGSVYADAQGMIALSLYLLPGWLLEGWMLSHAVRLILRDQRWPFQPSGNESKDLVRLEDRYRGIMGGLVSFALIQMLIAGWMALMFSFLPVDAEGVTQLDPADISQEASMVLFLMLAASVYLLRFLWLYVPVAAGGDLSGTARMLAPGALISLKIAGVWLICAMPVMFIMQMLAALILSGMPEEGGAFVMVVLRVVIDVVKNLLCALAMAYAFKEMFSNQFRREG